MDTLLTTVKQFFQSPRETKVKYTKGVMSHTGWTDVARENLNPAQRKAGDFKETYNYQPTMQMEVWLIF